MKTDSSVKACFKGRTAVLTGAASGIGRSLALQLVQCGATVHALDANADGLGEVKKECADGPGILHPAVLDVRDRDAYAAVLADIRKKSAVIDYLFNNAGVTQLGEAHRIPFERWQWLLDINLMGVVHGIELVYPLMIAQGGGHIISTSSIAGSTGYATAAAYTASKAAVLELTRSLRAEAKAYGVRVSVACPGYVDSGIFSEDRIVGASRASVMADLPVRPMTPDEAAVHYLKGVAKGRKTIVFPFTARLLWVVSKWAPFLNAPFQRRFVRVFREQ